MLEFEGCYCRGLLDHQGDGVVCASQEGTGRRRHNHQLLRLEQENWVTHDFTLHSTQALVYYLGQGLNALVRLGKEGQDSEEGRPARGQQVAKV